MTAFDAGQPVLLGQRGTRVEQRRACLQRAGGPSSVTHRPEYMPAGTGDPSMMTDRSVTVLGLVRYRPPTAQEQE